MSDKIAATEVASVRGGDLCLDVKATGVAVKELRHIVADLDLLSCRLGISSPAQVKLELVKIAACVRELIPDDESIHAKQDCGEAGHDQGACGNASCLPSNLLSPGGLT